ncbi:nitroreductase family protein [Algoriphagus hitonicola]|uniref:Nitroreductase n=1 Tax=Algoriphagus hitonicola TaxID=435880 RepID=A0A1I2X934_9BACT|nr:nitroreductase family protein [Algoriphagus hitonicola]SFH08521.1 Nitroreductase [Algoriphagus hitonicola]
MIKNINNKLKTIRNKIVKEILPPLFYNSSFLSTIYYLVINPSFRREIHAVLAGKVKYLKESKNSKNNYYLLVRNIHRLEKGLLMRPRKKIFAVDYIKETVDCYIGVSTSDQDKENKQLVWFLDVLNEYFNVVGDHPKINNEKVRFNNFKSKNFSDNSITSSLSIPYKRDFQNYSKISYEEFYELNRQRRSVRWFIEKPVPRELIDKAILAAIQAPSACNRQPFEYRIFDRKDLVAQAVELPMGTKGYSHSIQTFIVVIGNQDAYFDERDRHLIYIDASLANMVFMLALETLGLGSCPINWPDIEEREEKMKSFLNLKTYQRPVMCIGVGYPDIEGMVAFSEKRSLKNIRKYNYDN